MDSAKSRPAAPEYIRPHPLAHKLGISPSTLWKISREREDFPAPIKFTPRVTVWRISDVEAWIERRAAEPRVGA